MEKLYEFINNGKNVIIKTPVTPRPWLNYLWNEDGYLSSVSQTGNGNSQYLTQEMQLEKMSEQTGRYFYVRDDDRGISWNPGFAPLYNDVEVFECEHTLTHSIIRSKKEEISVSIQYFVPLTGLQELWTVTVKNNSVQPRNISLFPVVDMDLEGDFPQPRYYHNGTFTTMTYEESINGIYAWANNPYAPHDKYKGFFTSSEKIFGYDCSTTKFLGGDTNFSYPKLLLEGKDCTNSENVATLRTAVLQNKIHLAPGESKIISYCLGFCASLQNAQEICNKVFQNDFLKRSLQDCENHWDRIINHCVIETPDDKINHIMNNWVKKQMIFCKDSKKGVRDNMQIADGVLQIWPESGRQEILEVLSHQFKDGHTLLTWFPYDDTYYSDQPIWLVMGVTGYIKETG
jgi:cellobiose phosphorylase